MTIRLVYFFTLTFCLFSIKISAQNNKFMYNWHFGDKAAVNFSTGSPVSIETSQLISIEGSISHSDNNGDLLFYSNGGLYPGAPGYIWNRNNDIMPDGNLNYGMGCSNSPQSALIIQKAPEKYYMFTIGCSSNGLRVSEIDMTLDNGLGDLSEKGFPLLDSPDTLLSEALSATGHANGTDYWLMVHSRYTDTFYVYQVTPTDIIGPTAQKIGSMGIGASHTMLKFNIQGDQFVYRDNLYDFDNSSGVISNPVDIGILGLGKEFSVSGDLLYVSSFNNLWQFDLNAQDIAASKILIAYPLYMPALQIGPDFKIYATSETSHYLSVINSPETPGVGCNFQYDAIDLGEGICIKGLPNFISSDINPDTAIINDFSNSTPFQVFPNPATTTINILGYNSSQEYKIINQVGEIVQQDLIPLNNQIDISHISSGIYFIKINDTSTKLTIK